MTSLARKAGFAYRLLQGLARPSRVSFAIFFVTDLCNAKCPYCFNTRLGHLDPERVPADKEGLLSVEEYERIAANMRPLFQVVFGGGEPFLRPEIDRIAEVFCRKAGARLVSIPTNGSLPDRVFEKVSAMSSRCPEATFNLQVSLDACGAGHDRLRALPGGFEKATELCGRLLDARLGNVNVIVNTALTEHNVDEVEALQRYLSERFPAGLLHHVQLEQRLGARLYEDPALRARVREIDARAAAQAARGLGRRIISRYYIRFINALLVRQMVEGRMIYRCNAGRKLCVVMPDGEMSPCEPFVFDGHYRHFRRFNLRDFDYDARKVQRVPAFAEMRRFIEEGRCQACPWSCAAISSMTYSPRNWPLLFRTPSLDRARRAG